MSTLLEISKEIGISTATISRVINNEPNVAEDTRNLVLSALEKHGYQYKPRRKTMASVNTNLVMIVAGQIKNPITTQYIEGIRKVLEPSGKLVSVCISDYSDVKELEFLQYAKETGVAGVFMLNIIESDGLMRLLQSFDSPVILVNRYLRGMDTNLVTMDNYRCGYLSTSYLVERGHKKIGIIAGPVDSSITCQNRLQGFMDAMRYSKLEFKDSSIYYCDRSYQSGYSVGKEIAKMNKADRYSAVYCISGTLADGLTDALKESGLSIPEDVSIICNDDSNREYVRKEKTTCYEPNHFSIGEAAGRLFLDSMKVPHSTPRRIVYPPVLTEYNSVKTIS